MLDLNVEAARKVALGITDACGQAIALACDPARLMRLRALLLERRQLAPLFDTPLFARHLEAAYTRMLALHLAGLAAQDVQITAAL